MLRTRLYADPTGVFLHALILDACRRFGPKTAIVDTSCSPARRITYAEYGDLVERLARGLIAAGLHPGEVVAIRLANSWEFAAAFHATMLAGGIPTPMNPSYREREVRYQLQDSAAVFLISDAPLLAEISLAGLPTLRRLFWTRQAAAGAEPFSNLLASSTATLPAPERPPTEIVAALPYSSGTTGLPKGVMLSHSNLVTNNFQFLAPGEQATWTASDVMLCFLPLYHIYGLNVVLSPTLAVGATLVLMPRCEEATLISLLTNEGVTFLPVVPPVLNLLCHAADAGRFPRDHRVRAVKSGAAPLAPDLARRFTALTGIPVRQGYGMTEASPVTHMGFVEESLYCPETIGPPLAQTECGVLDEEGREVPVGELGELVMRGPQIMLGYWNAPEATAAALRDGWYFSGDVVRIEATLPPAQRYRELTGEPGFYRVVDRRKEMIKYKGFAIAPAELESVLLEHPAVRDCGVVGVPDSDAGEVPCAFVVLRPDQPSGDRTAAELTDFVVQRLSKYKQPRQVRFVDSIPRNPSGKILRRALRDLL